MDTEFRLPKRDLQEFTELAEEETGDLDPYGKVSMGTTILACTFKDGVILAADTRTSAGSYIWGRGTNKLTKLSDKIYCCRSGSAADTQFLAEYVSHLLDSHSIESGAEPTVETASRLFQLLCYYNKYALQAGIIVAGWDETDGPKIFNNPIGGARIPMDVCIGGSGSTFLYGWMDDNWKPGMTKEEALNFMRKAVAHAIARDASSGGMCRTMIITKDGTEHTTIGWPDMSFKLENADRFKDLTNPTHNQF
eukprot:TRINITY_DN74950_c0_g1_i1.p1 TRINITY_DN74950_c0_g1~~TRINITY_DN74950_c0_g1_i1.p1  ORF type:complete len:268 (+),score=21.49 TRINITY_DN74950_c0_g1_i1:53-805(+)